jgi:predicted transposase YbfD/YdcC
VFGGQPSLTDSAVWSKSPIRCKPQLPSKHCLRPPCQALRAAAREDVEVFAAEQKANGFADTKISRDTTIDGDHVRIETRTTTVIHDVEWLRKRHDWPGLKAVVMVESSREIRGKIQLETRFYITSLAMLAHLLGPVIRSHWAVENSLHWIMDMSSATTSAVSEPITPRPIFTTIKHMAHNLLRKASGKDSLRLRRKVAAWDHAFLTSLIAA